MKLKVVIKHLLNNIKTESATVNKETELSGLKSPKINVPIFDVKIVNWKNFWEQFNAIIHSKTGLNDTNKLIYFQDAH